MTSVCRGRGWGSNVDRGALRRPGEVTPVESPEVEMLMAAVHNLNLQDPVTSAATLRTFDEQIKLLCLSADVLKTFVQQLHDRSLDDRQFGLKAAAACGVSHTFEVNGVKLRTLFLMATQKDYEEYAQLQTANIAKFLNSVALLGEIFHRVRLNDGSPIKVLATPVMHYQDLLLSGEEHEMELFTTLLSVNGRKLLDCCASELEDLLLRVRTVLMSRNLSGQCRCWLLLALDLAANRYSPLPGPLQNFYQVHLGATALSQLQRVDTGLTIETGTAPVSHSLLQTQPQADLKAARESVEDAVPTPTPVRELSDTDLRNKITSRSESRTTPVRELSDTDLRHKITSHGEPRADRKVKNLDDDSKTEQNNSKEQVDDDSDSRSNNNYRGRNSDDGNKKEDGVRFKSNRNFSDGPRRAKSPVGRTRRFSSNNSRSEDLKEESKSWRNEPRNIEEEEKWGLGDRSSNKKPVWGHDDRFEKDDSFYGKQAPREEGVGRFRGGLIPSQRDVGGGDGKRPGRSDGGKGRDVRDKGRSNAKGDSAVSAPVANKLPAAPVIETEETWD